MITIYTTPTCAFCHMAKNYFKSQGLEYKEIDVAREPTGAQMLIEKSGQLGVPVIDVDGKIIVGFNRPALEMVLQDNSQSN